jgi:predicted transcriptional regulator YheO
MKFSKKDGQVDGMLCVNIDHTRLSEFGAYIRHFSVVDRSQFTKALEMALDYIWKNLYADNVRIDLYHFEHEGKF